MTLRASSTLAYSSVLVIRSASGAPDGQDPRLVGWLGMFESVIELPLDVASIVDRVLRDPPRVILVEIMECSGEDSEDRRRALVTRVLSVIRQLKGDPSTAIVPVVGVVPGDLAVILDAGADDAIGTTMSAGEVRARLDAVLRRSERDLDVHPSTRLPGARAIDAELRRRLALGAPFAVGYADLDHFKEFNDRYGYERGNGVILLLSKILHDVVRGHCGASGFVGHIGGDDFLFAIPLDAMTAVCDEIITLFDELIPHQYSEEDRQMGYFLGKDRRGQLHQVPLMTLSIGVVTSQWRRFTRVSEVSDLATEMKTFAKGKPGSLWAVDRRRDDDSSAPMPEREAGPRDIGGAS